MMKTLIISTAINEKVLNKLLEQYGVEVYYNMYEYKEMAFKEEDETKFKDTFFEVMRYLASKDIFVTVYDILVQVQSQKNPKDADYVNFTNRYHTQYSKLDFLERV
jgi:hypothetical protein